jgi:activator of 2-hydroxyglutaryl-CoA dehydratase
LGIPIDEVGPLSLSVDDEQLQERLALALGEVQGSLEEGGVLPLYATLSAVCDVLAKSQAMGLLRNGWSKAEILAAYCAGIAHQAALLVKRIGITGELTITGGVVKNIGVVRRLEKELGIDVAIPNLDPQLTGALGAALFAVDLLENRFKSAQSQKRNIRDDRRP